MTSDKEIGANFAGKFYPNQNNQITYMVFFSEFDSLKHTRNVFRYDIENVKVQQVSCHGYETRGRPR